MGDLIISNKEEQVKIFELLTNKAMTQKAASIRLKMTTRGIRKKIKRFKEYLEMACGHPRKTDLNTESELFMLAALKQKGVLNVLIERARSLG